MEEYKRLFIDNASQLIDFRGKTILEVGCGNGDMLKEIACKFFPGYVVGIDNNLDMWFARAASRDNWEIAEGDAAALKYPDNFFDTVISVGVFEHLLNLKGSLAEIKRVLKPCGKVYTEFSPVWSSVTGHHYNFWVEEDAGLIPGWGHLWLDEPGMLAYLEPQIGGERAEKACYDIYRSNYINRLTRIEYYEIILNSGFWIRELKEHVSFSSRYFFNKYESELTAEIYEKLKGAYQLHELAVLGFTILLEKHADI